MKYFVALDGSEESRAALEYAYEVADAMDATVIGVHAVDPTLSDLGRMDPIMSRSDAERQLVLESVEDAEDRGDAILEHAEAFAERSGYDIDTELVYGPPAQAIADFASAEGADAIFVGHRGRTERGNFLLGSVAKSLVERATVPVTVVR